MTSGFQIWIVLRDLRIAPVPEQGASKRTLSACRENLCPFIKVIIVLRTPHLCKLIVNDFNLVWVISFAMIIPLLFIMDASWVVLLPGAAAISKMRLLWWVFNANGGIIDAAS